jgi:hypothetical protein
MQKEYTNLELDLELELDSLLAAPAEPPGDAMSMVFVLHDRDGGRGEISSMSGCEKNLDVRGC